VEKQGPHLPLGTDLLKVRYEAVHAAEREYAVVFPEYYFGQIFETRHVKNTSVDMHAGESETSKMMISNPNLVHFDRAQKKLITLG
jgi:creatinine amidohydrolase/Fe(II)-dependent formamide hydrolase-like protein